MNLLAPWMLYIKLGLAALLLGGLFVGGCNHGTRAQAARDAKALAAAEARVSACKAQVAICAATLATIDQNTAQARREAAEQAKRADEAVKRAAANHVAYLRSMADIEGELSAARRDPACAEQLAETLCVALR